MAPGQLSAQFADFGRQFQQQALDDQIARFNYYQNLPNQTLSQLGGLVFPGAGFGGVQTSQLPPGNSRAGALGGALSGAAAGTAIAPGYGTAIGALVGGLGGYFGSR